MQDSAVSTNEYLVTSVNTAAVNILQTTLSARKEKYAPPFDEKETELIRHCLLESSEPSAIAFYLSLYAGISPLEAAVLRYENLDFRQKEICVDSGAAVVDTKIIPVPIPVRRIPMLDCVNTFLRDRMAHTKDAGKYIFTDSTHCADSVRTVETTFRRILKTRLNPDGLYSTSLRSTFIRWCLEANMNIESVSSITGVSVRELSRDFSEYIHADHSVIHRLEKRSISEERKLNLLILGAGSHGHGVWETAKALGVFRKIRFLDDVVETDDVIGKCSEYAKFIMEFPAAFVAFGNNELRKKWTLALKEAGFIIPRLIHPHATISADAEIGDGTIVLAQATVNALAEIGDSCIIAQNSMIGFRAKVGAFSHVDCGGIVMKNAVVREMAVVHSAEVIHEADDESSNHNYIG